jgi:hypothetical protein
MLFFVGVGGVQILFLAFQDFEWCTFIYLSASSDFVDML